MLLVEVPSSLQRLNRAPHISSGQGSLRLHSTRRSERRLGQQPSQCRRTHFQPTSVCAGTAREGRVRVLQIRREYHIPHTFQGAYHILFWKESLESCPHRGGNAGAAARREAPGAWLCGNGLNEACNSAKMLEQ